MTKSEQLPDAELGSDSPLTDALCSALESGSAYPEDPSASAGVERVHTHISRLFLTGERVYKFRRGVDLGFVCFRSREERNRDCLNEVRLNRRLAPDLYLGVAPLQASPSGPRIGPVGETLVAGEDGEPAEHCVVMRRLPAGRDALSLLGRGELHEQHMDRVARKVARFHDRCSLGEPAPISRDDWFERCWEPLEECHAQVAAAAEMLGLGDEPARVLALSRRVALRLADAFESRRLRGFVLEAHGDMHLEHIWFEEDDSEPLIIDCLEFNEKLRRIDAASEVAFTAMDLRYRGAWQLAERYLRVYARERDDFDLYTVVDYFLSYRAAVRAKVAALAASDSAMDPERRERARDSTERHLALAARSLEARAPGDLILVGGAVGTGKSTVAEAVSDALEAVIVSTDRVRKQRLGLEATTRPDATQSGELYAESGKRATYAAVTQRARPALLSGRSVVLDGTFSSRNDREGAQQLAAELGARCLFVEVRCAPEVAIARLERRQAADADPSDAGPERHRPSLEEFQPLAGWPEAEHVVVRTDDASWREQLGLALQQLGAAQNALSG